MGGVKNGMEGLVEIKAMLGKGLSVEEVAGSLGVTPAWIKMVLSSDGYKSVPGDGYQESGER